MSGINFTHLSHISNIHIIDYDLVSHISMMLDEIDGFLFIVTHENLWLRFFSFSTYYCTVMILAFNRMLNMTSLFLHSCGIFLESTVTWNTLGWRWKKSSWINKAQSSSVFSVLLHVPVMSSYTVWTMSEKVTEPLSRVYKEGGIVRICWPSRIKFSTIMSLVFFCH